MASSTLSSSVNRGEAAGIPNDDRLDSWKEIAAYVNRTVRTARRWEKSEGLPVHRHEHTSDSTVYAFRSELDEWRARRQPVAASASFAMAQGMSVADPAPVAQAPSHSAIVIPRWLIWGLAGGGLGFCLLLLYGIFIRHWTFVIRL